MKPGLFLEHASRGIWLPPNCRERGASTYVFSFYPPGNQLCNYIDHANNNANLDDWTADIAYLFAPLRGPTAHVRNFVERACGIHEFSLRPANNNADPRGLAEVSHWRDSDALDHFHCSAWPSLRHRKVKHPLAKYTCRGIDLRRLDYCKKSAWN